jgi:hypothetical protein
MVGEKEPNEEAPMAAFSADLSAVSAFARAKT